MKFSSSDTQLILNNARNPFKLNSIRMRLRKNTGRICNGILPSYDWSKQFLGETYEKVIIAPKKINDLGKNNDTLFTVLGGWCAIRTKCLKDLSKGFITHPITGIKKSIKSVDQVGEWIENAISADQIVETIGIYNGIDYAAISEERLWTKKVINTLELFFNRELTDNEKQVILDAIAKAEKKRYEVTKKYIEYVSNKKISLKRIVDSDIFNDLVKGRNTLFDRFKVTLDTLVEPMIKRMLVKTDAEITISSKTKNDLYNYIDNSTLVWFMYTGLYLNILKEKKYIRTSKGVIMEPWSHAISNESEAKFNLLFFTDDNIYLNKGGINENIAFIGLDEVSTYNCVHSKSILPISDVPNINNYQKFLEKLYGNESVSNIDLNRNYSFLYGINYFPYGKCREALLEMIRIRDDFRKFKKNNKDDFHNSDIQKDTQIFRENKSSEIKIQSLIINKELLKMFDYIFRLNN